MTESHINFLGGSPLNRLSWLRSSNAVMNALTHSKSSKWIIFNEGKPLIATGDKGIKSLAYLSTNDIKPFLGSEPYFGQGEKDGSVLEPKDAENQIFQAARLRGANIVFLGIEEPNDDNKGALPSTDFTDPEKAVANLTGTPYFAIEVGDHFTQDEITRHLSNKPDHEFVDARAALQHLTTAFVGGVYASARSMVDWNSRNKFCPACSWPTYSIWAGWKKVCSSRLPWSKPEKPCVTERGLHNFNHPRTDPVVIMLVVNEQDDKVLLGRNKKFPGNFYSALAGFIEPGESFEDAVRREIWEEAGVKVWNVTYHSGQPWPYPANLMVGFYAVADSSKPIRLDLDNELADARWFTRDELRTVLAHVEGTKILNNQWKKMSEQDEGRGIKKVDDGSANLAPSEPTDNKPVSKVTPSDEPSFKLPGVIAIAGVLIKDWVEKDSSNRSANL